MNREVTRNAKSIVVARSQIEEGGRTVIGSAIRVHRELGPGLLESVYQACLAFELRKLGYSVGLERILPIRYRGESIDAGYRIDMIVEDLVIIENKAVERLLPIHAAQLLTYLRLGTCQLGFLLNWNVRLMKDGIQRFVMGL